MKYVEFVGFLFVAVMTVGSFAVSAFYLSNCMWCGVVVGVGIIMLYWWLTKREKEVKEKDVEIRFLVHDI